MRHRLLLVPLIFLSLAIGASAQTSDQLDMLKNLPSDQQDSLLQGVLGKSDGGAKKTDPKLSTPETVLSKSSSANAFADKDKNKTSDGRTLRVADENPELRAEDDILIDLTPMEIEDKDDQGNYHPNGGNTGGGATQIPPTSQYPSTQNPAAAAAVAGLGAGALGTNATGTLNGTQTNGMRNPPPFNDFGRIQPTYKTRSDAEKKKIEDLRQLILRGNPYHLNQFGVLEMPGLPAIPLAGLTADEATNRISADPDLRDFKIRVTLLRLMPFDEQALKPFGYDLFEGSPTTFAPVSDIQVPVDYLVGPGDNMNIQVYGSDPGTYQLTVGRDGRINFPKLGPINVSGLTFDEARQAIEDRVSQQMIGSHVSVTMGDLRSIRVFVLGEAEKPGSYTVSALSTMTNALFVSGGVKKIGSLRKLELKRNGKTIGVLDLYDLLLHGDTSHDQRLMQGDVIFIPPIGDVVSVYGSVQRPAIYELKGEKSVEQIVDMAGGLKPDADGKTVQLERILPSRLRQMQNIDLTAAAGRDAQVENGDKLKIPAIRPTLENSVVLSGYVFRPGSFQYHKGLRLSDVIPSFDELRPTADRHYIMIRREIPPEEKVQVVSADLERALAARGTSADPELQARDKIIVFDLSAGRDRVVEPVLRDLELQGSPEKPAQVVSIDGQVKAPGRYPLEPSMHVSDLIRAGGSLKDSSFSGEAELTRYRIVDGTARETELIPVDLAAIRRGDVAANLELKPYDTLVIKVTPQWEKPGNIVLTGEVRFPGTYPIRRGETLSSVLKRAGGFTDLAFVYGAVFIREELKQREKDQLELLTTRMQSDLASLSLEAIASTAATSSGNGAAAGTSALAIGQQLVQQLRESKPIGRLVVDLDKVMRGRPGGQGDVTLRDGDKLLIPKQTQEITILGEVQAPTSHVYQPGLTRDEYIAKSGGTTQKADRPRIYVVRANGDVISGERSGWFRRSQSIDMRPGDTIVVPLDTERVRSLPLWQAVTTIIYNLAVALLAVRSV